MRDAGSRRPPARLAGPAALILAAVAVVVLVVWPQAFGLAGAPVAAQLVAVRGLAVLGGTAVVVALLLLGWWWRGGRRLVLAVAVIAGLGVAASTTVVLVRGVSGDEAAPADAADVTVLAFNTLRDGVPADDIAALVERTRADVVVLGETSREVTEAVAAVSGRFTVVHREIDGATSATGLLIDASFGGYREPELNDEGLLASFTVLPEDPAAPPITAVHTYPPGSGSMGLWRRDTSWAVAACTKEPGAIVAGDFNATLDHPAFRGLRPCVDAAAERGAAAVGTWPSTWPALLGSPIDHVVADGRAWKVIAFSVLDAHPGSDHRPVVATLRAR